MRETDSRNQSGRGLTWVRKPAKESSEGRSAEAVENNAGKEGVDELKMVLYRDKMLTTRKLARAKLWPIRKRTHAELLLTWK